MSAYVGLAAALQALARGQSADAAWQCVERAATVAARARVRAMGLPASTTFEDIAAEVFGRLADRAVASVLPTFASDPKAGKYFALTARSVIADIARRERREIGIEDAESGELLPSGQEDDSAAEFDPDETRKTGLDRYDSLVALLRTKRRPQDRPSLDRAAASLRRVAFEGQALDAVIAADGEWTEDPQGQRRARDGRYQAHKRLRDQLVELAGSPAAEALLAPWSGELAQRFFARWLIRCQLRGSGSSSSQESKP